MPNWVTTEIKIRGKAEDLAAFVKKHIVTYKYDNGRSEDMLDFETIIPSPKTIEECPKDCIANENSHIVIEEDRPWFDWYKWNINYWGTKWNSSNTSYPETDSILAQGSTEIEIWLDTAWDPAMPVYNKLQEMYPNLKIDVYYGDEGGFFVGHLHSDGEDEYYNGNYGRPEPKAICDEIGMEYLYRGPDDDEDDEEEGGVC